MGFRHSENTIIDNMVRGFDKIAYEPGRNGYSLSEVKKNCEFIIKRGASMDDCFQGGKYLDFFSDYDAEVRKILKKYPNFSSRLTGQGSVSVTRDGSRVYVITNLLSDKGVYAYRYDSSGKEHVYPFKKSLFGGKYTVEGFADGYSMKLAKGKPLKFELTYTSDGSFRYSYVEATVGEDGNLVTTEKSDEHNLGGVLYSDGVGLYRNDYLKQVGKWKPNQDNMKASFSWKVIDYHKGTFISRVEIYDEGLGSSQRECLLLAAYAAAMIAIKK